MEEIQVIEINARLEGLTSQRNEAMNAVVIASAELAKLKWQYKQLENLYESAKAHISELEDTINEYQVEDTTEDEPI